MVVTVPLDPRYTKAPPLQYRIPPPDGLVVGLTLALAMKITPVPVP
jgi:hypothetical protein